MQEDEEKKINKEELEEEEEIENEKEEEIEDEEDEEDEDEEDEEDADEEDADEEDEEDEENEDEEDEEKEDEEATVKKSDFETLETSSKVTAPEEIPLPIVVEVGRFQMSVKKLMDLEPGNILELDIHPESGINLVINGQLVAKGELLKIGDTLGVRILEK